MILNRRPEARQVGIVCCGKTAVRAACLKGVRLVAIGVAAIVKSILDFRKAGSTIILRAPASLFVAKGLASPRGKKACASDQPGCFIDWIAVSLYTNMRSVLNASPHL